MKIELHSKLRRSIVTRWPFALLDWVSFAKWQLAGKKTGFGMPGLRKRQILVSIAKQHGIDTVVETGTYLGDTTYFLHRSGLNVITIEVAPQIAALARERFANIDGIKVLEGDSGDLLAQVLDGLEKPALFWLDGHYSGGATGQGALETPVVSETNHILQKAKAGSVVVVDDARCFGRFPDYPSMNVFQAQLAAGGATAIQEQEDFISFVVGNNSG